MKPTKNYQISILNDFKRLNEVHELAYSSYFKTKQNDKPSNINLFPLLDTSENTKTIIIESGGKIIGTNSMTVDGKQGLPSDKYFKKETDFIRKNSTGKLGNSWKIATSKEHGKSTRILFDILQHTVKLAVEMEVDTCLYIFPKKHENIYKKFINADTIAEKKCTIGNKKNVHLVLMKTETKKTIEHLNKLFTNRQF